MGSPPLVRPSRNEVVALTFAYGVIMTFGALSNGVIIATFIRWRRSMLKHRRDIFLLHLAVGDFIVCSAVTPLSFGSAMSREWTSGRSGCIFYGFISTWMGLCNMLQLVSISIERYYTLSCWNPRHVTKMWVKGLMLFFPWSFSFVCSCLPLFGWSEYTFEGFGLHCSIHWGTQNINYASYSLFLLFFFFVVPVSAICVSYVKVFFIIKQMSHNAAAMWGKEAGATRESYLVEVKIAKQLLLVTGGFLFAWTPYAVMSLIVTFTNHKLSTSVQVLPAIFAKTANLYNPIIYFFTYKRLLNKARCLLHLGRRTTTREVVEPYETEHGDEAIKMSAVGQHRVNKHSLTGS